MGTLTKDLDRPGPRESDWTDWLCEHTSEVSLDRLIPPDSRVVVVAPHPDDELLGIGGILANAVAAHRPLSIIAVTDGTASHPGSRIWTPRRLAITRRRESRRGLARLGAASAHIVRLGFEDGHVARREATLERVLRRRLIRGDVVFTTWRDDGHPDHEAVGRAAERASRANGCTLIEVPVWTWTWSHPGDRRVPWSRACKVALDERTVESKRAGIAAHRTQMRADASSGRPPVLGPASVKRFLRMFEVVLR
ncbi:MAG TPA: PIG-L family deacetylase [Casimicrobiaceae bacterium]|jgi:LmbE family N-acetylglucosaminyl deacetylase